MFTWLSRTGRLAHGAARPCSIPPLFNLSTMPRMATPAFVTEQVGPVSMKGSVSLAQALGWQKTMCLPELRSRATEMTGLSLHDCFAYRGTC